MSSGADEDRDLSDDCGDINGPTSKKSYKFLMRPLGDRLGIGSDSPLGLCVVLMGPPYDLVPDGTSYEREMLLGVS